MLNGSIAGRSRNLPGELYMTPEGPMDGMIYCLIAGVAFGTMLADIFWNGFDDAVRRWRSDKH